MAKAAKKKKRTQSVQEALEQVRTLLQKHRIVEGMVHKQDMPRHELVESLVHKQNLAELQRKLDKLHPADVAYILEALPLEERLVVWDLVKAERDGEILLEVSDSVRETLIENMDAHELVGAVMNTDFITLSPDDKAQQAAQSFERYDLVSAPVVDQGNRLVGRVTVDVVVDFIRRRNEAEQLSHAGLLEEEDIFASVWKSAKNRWLWLAVNLGTAFFASRVIGAFEGTIERLVALSPLIAIC